MTDRRQQIGRLMEKLHSLKRIMAPDQSNLGGDCLAQSQWLALHLVSRQEGIGIKELAGQLGITSSAATQLVENLVNKGLLIRQPSAEDRRALCLSLPEESRKQVDAIKEERLGHLATVFESLNDTEFETLINLIDKVVNPPSSEER